MKPKSKFILEHQIVTEFDPLAVQEPHVIEKQQDSPVQHGQVIPQIQEFLREGKEGSFINDVTRLFNSTPLFNELNRNPSL
jgi:hypothetical protein